MLGLARVDCLHAFIYRIFPFDPQTLTRTVGSLFFVLFFRNQVWVLSQLRRSGELGFALIEFKVLGSEEYVSWIVFSMFRPYVMGLMWDQVSLSHFF